MDIRQWLQNTADREPPDEEEHPRLPAFPQPQPRHRRARQRRRRGVRSSDLADAVRKRNRHDEPESSDHDTLTDAASRSHVSCSRNSIPSDRDHGLTKSYERRARHKTKADRYELKKRKRSKDRDDVRRDEKKQKRRGGARRGDGSRTTGLVQSFQLKDIPRNHRLTVRISATWKQCAILTTCSAKTRAYCWSVQARAGLCTYRCERSRL